MKKIIFKEDENNTVIIAGAAPEIDAIKTPQQLAEHLNRVADIFGDGSEWRAEICKY